MGRMVECVGELVVATAGGDGFDESHHASQWTVHQGDARGADDFLSRTADAILGTYEPFVQVTVTSPPYATLVDYGGENQIGFGQTYEEYLASCRKIFEDTYKWTLETGSMWVVADSVIGRSGEPRKVSRLIPLPFDLASEAEAVGWTLREVVVWRKDRTRPWSHRGKLRNGFEYVLLFVKSTAFKFNVDRLRDTNNLKSWWVKYPERHNPWGMAPDNVWEIPIPVQGSWDANAFRHACPFPPELVRRMIELSSDEGDVVFDPFAGSGSVVNGANRLGRRGLGLELNPDFVSAFNANPKPVTRQAADGPTVSTMTRRLLELRMLKYPKELAKQVLREGFTTADLLGVIMQVESVNYNPAKAGFGKIKCLMIISDGVPAIARARLAKTVDEARLRAPLSKYGLEATIEIVEISRLSGSVEDRQFSIYPSGRTWYAESTLDSQSLVAWLGGPKPPRVVPIISTLHVEQSLEESL